MPLEPDPDPDQESKPTPEDLDYYYGLNRRSAKKQDVPFANWGALVFIGVLSLIPINILLMFFAGSQIGFGVYLLLILIAIACPVLLLVIPLMGILSFSSLLEWMRQTFACKDK